MKKQTTPTKDKPAVVRKARRTLEKFMAKEEICAVPDGVRGVYLYGLQLTGL